MFTVKSYILRPDARIYDWDYALKNLNEYFIDIDNAMEMKKAANANLIVGHKG